MVHHRDRARGNGDALSHIPGHLSGDSDMLPIASVVLATVLNNRSPQDVRDLQLNDELIGTIFRAKIHDTSIKGLSEAGANLGSVDDL